MRMRLMTHEEHLKCSSCLSALHARSAAPCSSTLSGSLAQYCQFVIRCAYHADARSVTVEYRGVAYHVVHTSAATTTVPHWGVLRTAKHVTTTSELMCTSCDSALLDNDSVVACC